MTAIHAHLFLNHIPVVGLMFGLVFLIAGMKRSSVQTLLTSLRIFVVMGLTAIPGSHQWTGCRKGAPSCSLFGCRCCQPTSTGRYSHARRSGRSGSLRWHPITGIVTQGHPVGPGEGSGSRSRSRGF